MDVLEKDVEIETNDGVCEASLSYPVEGEYPAVIIWTDIGGLRPAFREMGKKLASQGYSVLIPNPFYRLSRLPTPEKDFDFKNPDHKSKGIEMMKTLYEEGGIENDTINFVKYLDEQKHVNPSKKMGVNGYCMGGFMMMRTVSALPERFGAGCSFHGGGLVIDGPKSPHHLIPKMKSNFHIAIACDDDEKEPHVKDTLRETFNDAGLNANIKVYEDARHGWCVSDTPVFHASQARVAWDTFSTIFKKSLV